jgi:hypothetical protein
MSKFEDELNKATNPHSKRKLKVNLLIESLRTKGQTDEADAIDAAISNVDIPAYTIFRALENSGYQVSYNAIQAARRQRASA